MKRKYLVTGRSILLINVESDTVVLLHEGLQRMGIGLSQHMALAYDKTLGSAGRQAHHEAIKSLVESRLLFFNCSVDRATTTTTK